MLAVGLLVRVTLASQAPVLVLGDSETYLGPALDLARGGAMDLTLKRTPAYPLLVAASLRWLGEDLRALAVVQHALGLASAALAYLLAARLAGRLAALLAGLATAVAGNLLIFERLVMSETLFTTLLLAAVLALALGVGAPHQRWLVVAGLLVGTAALVRPVAQALLLLAVLTPLSFRHGWRSAISGLLLVGLGYGLIVAPWLIRGAMSGESASVGALGQTLVGRTARHDRRDPALDNGFLFYDPARDGADSDATRLAARRILQEAANRGSSGRAVHTRLKKELGLSDAAADQLMRSLAVEAILNRPGYYVAGSVLRFVRLWTAPPERLSATVNEQIAVRREWEHEPSAAVLAWSPDQSAGTWSAAESLTTIFQPGLLGWGLPLLFALGSAAAIVERRYRAAVVPAIATLLLTGLSAALVGGVARYRYPEDPLILVVSSVGLVWVASAARRRLVRAKS